MKNSISILEFVKDLNVELYNEFGDVAQKIQFYENFKTFLPGKIFGPPSYVGLFV